MKNKTYHRAYKRVISGEAGESELQMLLLWAENEKKEWTNFIELLKNKLTTRK